MQDLRDTLYALIAPVQPVTIRQAFYLAVSAGVVEKTEQQYKGTVCRLLSDMRRDEQIPWGWIADHTRWMRKPRTYSSLERALEETARTYRRNLWDAQDVYVEVWLEKDALAGVLWPITEQYDVPLMVSRGYASLSYLYEAAEAIRHQGKPAYIYYFGDWDPSGLDIPRHIEQQLRHLSQDAPISFERMAVLPWQLGAWQLPTRPTKTSDTRSKAFTGESVEVDAIPPVRLRDLVANCISQHIDLHTLRITEAAEESERELLQLFSAPNVWNVIRERR
jgi:hypothetical protein